MNTFAAFHYFVEKFEARFLLCKNVLTSSEGLLNYGWVNALIDLTTEQSQQCWLYFGHKSSGNQASAVFY